MADVPMTPPPAGAGAGPDAGAAGGDLPDEKFGAQLLRRLHADRLHLMQEFHDYLQHLEEPDVRKLIEGLLATSDEEMSAIEDFFGSHEDYSQYPPIDQGGGDIDEANVGGEPPTPAGATEGLAEPTPEEAVEGMQTRTGEQEREDESESRPPIAGAEKSLNGVAKTKGLPDEAAKALEFYRLCKGVCPECGDNPCTCGADKEGELGVEGSHEPGEEAAHEKEEDEESGGPQHDEEEEKGYGDGIKSHHVPHVEAAGTFLTKLATEPELTGDHRLNAFHHGKMCHHIADELTGKTGSKATAEGGVNVHGKLEATPEEIGQAAQLVGMAAGASLEGGETKGLPSEEEGAPSPEKAKKILEDGEVNGKPLTEKQKRYFGYLAGRGKKDMSGEEPFPQMEKIDDLSEVQLGAELHPHVKTLKAAGTFLNGLVKAHPDAFDNDKRAKSAALGADFNNILHQVQQGLTGKQSKPCDETAKVNVGETGEKSLAVKNEKIKEEVVKQRKQMVELNGQLKMLMEALKERNGIAVG